MPIHNVEVAAIFYQLADLLEIQGANPFRVRAYRNAARIIQGLPHDLDVMLKAGDDLTELPGIGDDLAEKIKTIIETGELPYLKQIQKKLPPILSELMLIEGLGPLRVQMLYKKLKLKTRDDLKKAIEKGRLRQIRGFGEKMEQKILKGLAEDIHPARRKLAEMTPIVESLLTYLKKNPDIKDVEYAGSYRRRKETIGDLDFLVTTDRQKEVADYFVNYDEVENTLSKGTTRTTVKLHSGIQVDLRAVPEKSKGAALLYFTGSKEHNIALRKMALKKKLKLNEYGIFKGTKSLAGKTETDVYALLDLPYIDPEIREDRGEIEAALANQLPKLIQLQNIRGDLHCHTNQTDGIASLEQMAKAAEAKGYEYLAITDHSSKIAFAHGLDKKALFAQIKAIDKLNAKLKKLVVLKSIEVDILENGLLDLPNEVLKELDLTICAVHSQFHLAPDKQTERLIRAMDNPYFNILAHPTCRLINKRPPLSLDIERLLIAAKERHCIMELNAQPDRLDLNDLHAQLAKRLGVKIAINSDAHQVEQLNLMQYGIYQARRGWLEKSDVVNTLTLQKLRKVLKR